MLCLEHISWNTPEGTPVLRDVSLEIPDGKLVVITGPNVPRYEQKTLSIT